MLPLVRSPLTNQRGLIIIDFIFAAVLFSVFVSIIFSFAITFSVVEVLQYVSFASARQYSLAHQTEERQEQRGRQKFEELMANPALVPMISAGWFATGDPQIGDFNQDLANDNDRNLDSENFNGVRIPFSAPILYKRLPLLGDTGSPDGFQAFIQSFTGREPSFEECLNFTRQRGAGVQNLYGIANGDQYAVQSDNGC